MWIKNNVIIGSGALIGTWVSYGARKFKINLEDLSMIEKDRMESGIYNNKAVSVIGDALR